LLTGPAAWGDTRAERHTPFDAPTLDLVVTKRGLAARGWLALDASGQSKIAGIPGYTRTTDLYLASDALCPSKGGEDG
jgi:hypothetical protein